MISYIWLIIKSILIPDSYKSLSQSDILLICQDVDRGDVVNEKFFSKLIDSVGVIIDNVGMKHCSLSIPFSRMSQSKTFGNAATANRLFLFCILKYSLRMVFQKYFGLDKGKKLNRDDYFYNVFLKIVKPKVVIAIGTSPALAYSCKEGGVAIIELLHGMGYADIPWGWEKLRSDSLPTAVISFDDMSTKTFSSLTLQGVNVSQLPHPWYEMVEPEWDKRYTEEKILRTIPTWLVGNKKKILLFSLSWGYGGDHGQYIQFKDILRNGLFPNEITEAIEATSETVLWLFRLHPVQLRSVNLIYSRQRDYLEEVCKIYKNCLWKEPSEIFLSELLPHIDAHMSMISMTAYDAAYYGVRSLMLCPTLKSGSVYEGYFTDLKQSGYLDLGEFNSNEIIRWVSENATKLPKLKARHTTTWEDILINSVRH